MKELLQLNLGCGLNAHPDWVNIDSSILARLSKYTFLYGILCKLVKIDPVAWPTDIRVLDVTRGLPFPDGSAGAIFSSHFIEHLTLEEAHFVLGECYRCLCTNGVIRIITPDLFEIAKRYVEMTIDDPKSEHGKRFVTAMRLIDKPYTGIMKQVYKLFSRSKHLYMYDQWSLYELLENHGFQNIQRMTYGNSQIPNIKSLEDNGQHEMAICLEGIKKNK